MASVQGFEKLKNVQYLGKPSGAAAISFTAVQIQVVYRQALTAFFKTDSSLARQGLALQDHIDYESIYLQLLIMESSVFSTQECMKRRDN